MGLVVDPMADLTGPVTTATVHGTTGTNLGTTMIVRTQMTGVHGTTMTVPATTGMGHMISAMTDMGPRAENPVVRIDIPTRMILVDISVRRTAIVRTDLIVEIVRTIQIVMGHEGIHAGMPRNHGTDPTTNLVMGIVLIQELVLVMIVILPSMWVMATDLRVGHMEIGRAGKPTGTGNHVTVPMGMTRSHVMIPTVGIARVDGPAGSLMVNVRGTVTAQAGNPMVIVEEDPSIAMIKAAGPRTVMTGAGNPRTVMTAEGNLRTVMTAEGNRPTAIVVTAVEDRTGSARTNPRTVTIVEGNQLMGIVGGNQLIAMTVAARVTPAANSGRTMRAEGQTAIRAGTVKNPRTVLDSGLMAHATGIVKGPIRKTIRVHVMTRSGDRGSSRGNATAAKNLSRPGPGWRHARMSRLCPYSMKM